MRFVVSVVLTIMITLFGRTQETPKEDTLKHPYKKAMLYSACIPGGGQIYNSLNTSGRKNAYWKVPLIYTALGAASYFLVSNQLTQKSLKEEYTNRMNGGLPSSTWEEYDSQGVLTLYRQYLDWRDMSILGLAAIYGLQILDAGVEAHFLKFDVSDDVSLNWSPTIMSRKTVGLSIQLKF
ncbi:MAG: hypothetical protein RL264_1065 [Bacteroidota bacterium]|jgi:hypothetical protein